MMISKKIYDRTVNDVKRVQTLLNYHGHNLAVDGIWGNKTQKAVGDFQRSKGLKVDYIVGNQTLAKLNSLPEYKAPHFRDSEFYCKCCKGLPSRGVSVALLMLLEEIRARVNETYPLKNGKERGIIINSGYRCPAHNTNVGGATNSQHKQNPCKAADIRVKGITPKQLGVICDKINKNGGVGLGGKNIVHVDVRGHHARWWY